MDIGIITDTDADNNMDSDGVVRIAQVEFADDDVQTVEVASICGIDYNPPNDAIAFVVDAYDSARICVASEDGIAPAVDRGEIEIYSQLNKSKKSRIHLLNDGTIQIYAGSSENISIDNGTMTIKVDTLIIDADIVEIAGNADFAVSFNDLKSGFDKLKSDFNNFINTYYNFHTHQFAALGAPSPPVLPGMPTTADISAAKVDKVKLP